MDIITRLKFLTLWQQGISAGLSSSDSRELAALEIYNKSYADAFNKTNSNSQGTERNSSAN